ncbi:hypothetical protein [Clostridium sp. E02]|uniref:hypothetical protein n=1 Tax=Clostridium sp. E02 TaxID=2487134 RepID=UPI000F521BD9|nr:hypothetical protein [Clostridium sp. E02]
MNLDEKIALLERARRQKEKEESAKEIKGDQTIPVEKLSLEKALDGIKAGEIRLENDELFEFETSEYTERKIPLVLFKNFYQATKLEKEGAIYVNHTHEVSQILSWPKERIKPMSLDQWANVLVNGMAANRLHAKITKKKQLDHVEYICFDVPTGKGWIYNIIFRIRGEEQQFTGNYNCKKEDQDIYGIFLEAMVINLDSCLS